MSQQKVPLDAQGINGALQQLKKQFSQVEGEAISIRGDAATQLFQNFAQIVGGIFQENEKNVAELATIKATLESIYSGHPDIKIRMDKEAKEKQAPKVKGK
tara:strand:- start:423 stop:725 length:303 start_codon:yes stop_codon:yes gene_type:complete